MRRLEVRRHSMRKEGGGSQLSQEGIDLARAVGSRIGPFHRVVATVVPRARETAIAMGFAVDHEIVTLSVDRSVYEEAERSRWWEAEYPFVALAEVVASNGPLGLLAHATAALWRDVLMELSDGDSALAIGHSGELEPALVALFPEADHASWGGAFRPCEGARLTFDGDPPYFGDVEILREHSIQ